MDYQTRRFCPTQSRTGFQLQVADDDAYYYYFGNPTLLPTTPSQLPSSIPLSRPPSLNPTKPPTSIPTATLTPTYAPSARSTATPSAAPRAPSPAPLPPSSAPVAPSPAPVAPHSPPVLGCFPAGAEVEVAGKGVVKMNALQYGDRVKSVDRSGKVIFAEVFLFGHRSPEEYADYVSLQTESRSLQLSTTHFARICSSGCDEDGLRSGRFKMKSVFPQNVSAGDLLLEEAALNSSFAEGGKLRFAEVKAVSITIELGIYLPLVRGGDLIVNGVAVSPHSEWFLDFCSELLPLEGTLWQRTDFYEAILYALFVVYRLLGPEMAERCFEWLGLHGTWVIPYQFALVVVVLNMVLAAGALALAAAIRRLFGGIRSSN